ncbi:PTH1 family peptidyl-tRNA hydrolase [Catalinimonas alkaloidigena]|uniref:aminoacyl-tRNA hydrolase n=1 Tax=Catalinimonas alkaloidigena TaxID=1075417 RepID=UPI0024060CCB|nr:aminoacyl-tRNA hydrolase [Catalinimonas alkaloidigena]MDF9797679.1 PTH1 family peptidyl-tRNA hydrolase [Catalinimonas alkaloidigena]
MKFLIVGLGNPGPEYELNRHNIGFLTLDRLVDQHEVAFEQAKLGEVASFKAKGRSIYLLKPNTYMNRSGKAVNYWLQQLKVNIQNCLIVTDDIALPFGKLRMRAKGSSAGHNGLKDIESVVGGTQYPRLRFGVGNDFPKGRQVDYVLGNFPNDELEELPHLMDRAGEMIISFSTMGIERTMSQYND